MHRLVKGFWCSMLMSSVVRCFCAPTFHVLLLYRCYGVPSFVFTYSVILVLSAPVYITFSSSSHNVEGVFNSVVAGKFVRYFRPSWCSTRFCQKVQTPFPFTSEKIFLLRSGLLSKRFFFSITERFLAR